MSMARVTAGAGARLAVRTFTVNLTQRLEADGEPVEFNLEGLRRSLTARGERGVCGT